MSSLNIILFRVKLKLDFTSQDDVMSVNVTLNRGGHHSKNLTTKST